MCADPSERGVIFQQYALFPWLTVRQNVEFGLRIAGRRAAERRATAQRFIDLVGLSDFADSLPKVLSRHEAALRHRRAMRFDPTILLMDEPFGALDALTRVQMQDQLLDTWIRERRTVMFVTTTSTRPSYLATA